MYILLLKLYRTIHIISIRMKARVTWFHWKKKCFVSNVLLWNPVNQVDKKCQHRKAHKLWVTIEPFSQYVTFPFNRYTVSMFPLIILFLCRSLTPSLWLKLSSRLCVYYELFYTVLYMINKKKRTVYIYKYFFRCWFLFPLLTFIETEYTRMHMYIQVNGYRSQANVEQKL